jgi:hypothetical protein
VWLSSPAQSVTALVGRRHVKLTTSSGGSGAYRRTFFWQGFFRAPEIAVLASGENTAVVRVHAIAPNGNALTVRVTVPVSQGYG